MYWFEYDEDLARKAIADEAMQIGIETGREEKAVEMVKNLLTTNLSIEEIGRVVGWSKEKILKFLEKN